MIIAALLHALRFTFLRKIIGAILTYGLLEHSYQSVTGRSINFSLKLWTMYPDVRLHAVSTLDTVLFHIFYMLLIYFIITLLIKYWKVWSVSLMGLSIIFIWTSISSLFVNFNPVINVGMFTVTLSILFSVFRYFKLKLATTKL